MSIISALLAPSQTDQEYFAQLTKEITPRNYDEICHRMKELLNATEEINRKDCLPLIQKVQTFLEGNFITASAEIINVFLHNKKLLIKSGDLHRIMEFVVTKPEIHQSIFMPAFLSLCERSLITETDLNNLIDNKLDLVPFASLASDPGIIGFIVKTAQFEPSLRVPYVFQSLIEKIISTIGSNDTHLSLLAQLVSDPQSRQYFLSMNHLPALITVLFESRIKDLAMLAFRALLDPNDLIHLSSVQDQMFELEVPKQLMITMTQKDATLEMVQNAAICLGDSIKYRPLNELPFPIQTLFDLSISKPKAQMQLLHVLENLAESNPFLFPHDSILANQQILSIDPTFSLFISYLAYDCHHNSTIDLSMYQHVRGHALSLLYACAIQRDFYVEEADYNAQNPENDILQSLACADCAACRKGSLQRNILIQHASQFFIKHSNSFNPIAGGQSNDFFPRAFLEWGSHQYSSINRGRLIYDVMTYSTKKPEMVFEISPDYAHSNLLEMNKRATDIMKDNDSWKTRFETLENEHKKLIKDNSKLMMELIESRCQQLITVQDK